MSSRFRTYHEVEGDDRSRLLDQVVRQRARVVERLKRVRHVVAVMSGKGGVGKSHVTAGLATMATRHLAGVGVLDADLNGPTTGRLLAAAGPLRIDGDGVAPALGRDGVRVFSSDLLLEEGQPVQWRDRGGDRFVWRGTLEVGAVREFLSDVVWGELDLLLIDLPPGASHLADVVELVPGLTGAVTVTIPTDESRRSVERAMTAARESGVRLLGVIENMSGYACASCRTTGALFPGDAGEWLAKDFDVPLLGRVPFYPATTPADRRIDESTDREAAASAASAADSNRASPIVPDEVVTAFLECLP